ncbi:MAG: TIGR03560 family F420-dependent LLM class oxidoreductase [Nitrososphaerales archaeon]
MAKFGLSIARDGNDFQTIKNFVLRAEELGYESVWMTDHFFPFPQPTNKAYLEVLSVLSGLASVTSKIRLGILVLSNSYRLPSMLAKISSTIDNISDGRLEFGLGAGWFEPEYTAYGYPYPKASVRIAQLKEALQIIKLMWTQETPSFEGKHYKISEVLCSPKPTQKPHPPITVGGEGERILHVVAEEADRWNFRGYFATIEDFKKKSLELDNICKDVGRDPATVQRSIAGLLTTDADENKLKEKLEGMARYRPGLKVEDLLTKGFTGSPEQCGERLKSFVAEGASYFMLGRIDITQLEMVMDRVLKPSGF